MTDSISLKMKPGAAVLMALALITTTFAGVSFADPSDGSNASNTMVSMDYDELEIHVEQYDNGSAVGTMSASLTIMNTETGIDTWTGTEDLLIQDDNTSWNTHFAVFDLTAFFEGNETHEPMADEGTWYEVYADVYDSYDNYLGYDDVMICMLNGSVCESEDQFDWEEELFAEIDANGDGAINGSELIDFDNSLRADDNMAAMDEDEENELLADMANYDLGWENIDGTDYDEIAEDGVLEFNEFMDFYYNEYVNDMDDMTDFDLHYEDDGDNRTLEIHINDAGDYGYTFISIIDMNENEVYNTTFNTTFWMLDLDENNLGDSMYGITVTIYDEMGNIVYMSGASFGEMDYDQMVFDMFDDNLDGIISWEEYSLILWGSETDGDDEDDREHFDMVDANGDGAVNASELIDYENALLVEDDEPEMNSDEESELLAEMADYDIGWESMDGSDTEDAGDGMLEYNEFLAFENGDSMMDNATLNLFMNMFLSQDIDGDGGLDMDEFMAFNEMMNGGGDDNGDDGNDEPDEIEFMMMMLDADGDGNLSLTEIMVMNDDDETMSVTFFTNVFNHNDFNGDGMLDLLELGMFLDHMDSMDSEICDYVKTGDALKEDGYLMDDDGNEIDVMAGDTAAFDGEYCYNEDAPMSGDMMIFMADSNNDGKLSLTEIIAMFNGMNTESNQEPLSDMEEEWMSIAFMMADVNGDELLDEDEFMEFYYRINPDDHGDDDDGGMDHDDEHDHSEDQMVCYDRATHTPMMDITMQSDCEAAGYIWANMNDQPGHEDEDNQEDMLRFYDVDVWFEQWNDQSMELVIVEMAVLDNQEEIDRLVMMADAEYGNNDTVLDQAEVDMLMGLYALSLNPDDMAEGLTLDGQNGTAVDFWVEVDGLLEGSDVVFLRLATVIQFPTTAYDNSSTHTFIVHDDEHDDDMMNSDNRSMEDSMPCEDEEMGVWIHNSETWSIGSAVDSAGIMEFTYDETNNMWYSKDDGCSDIGSITFILNKTENGALPDAQDDDWTWEEEEMNMFPICSWHYSVTLANGSMMEDQWMDEAPESGDYEIVLIDDAAYEIFVSCWDPEGGKMVVEVTNPLGVNSSNTSIGEAMGHVSFKLPAGTGGNVTFDVTWTDGYHTESGTLTVFATGNGTVDLSDVETEGEGVLPGFTVGLGVIAMLGAAMIAGRRNNA